MATLQQGRPPSSWSLAARGHALGFAFRTRRDRRRPVVPFQRMDRPRKLGQSCCVRRLGTSAHDVNLFKTQIATAQASRPLRSFTKSSHVEPIARPCRHLLLPRAASRYPIALSRVPSVRSGTSSLPVTLSGRRIRSCFDASWRNGKGGRRSPDEHDLLEDMPVQMTAEFYMTRSAPAT